MSEEKRLWIVKNSRGEILPYTIAWRQELARTTARHRMKMSWETLESLGFKLVQIAVREITEEYAQ